MFETFFILVVQYDDDEISARTTSVSNNTFKFSILLGSRNTISNKIQKTNMYTLINTFRNKYTVVVVKIQITHSHIHTISIEFRFIYTWT